jgi:myo-inositol-1(or 4)-monophosphatase
VIGALKEACLQVHARTKGMAGTALGNRQMGRGAGGDISRRMDLVAEKTVMEVLKKRKVDATIIGEECGRIEGKENGFVIMDGIDGTTNATRRIPFYCCSLAYADEFHLSAVKHAAIIDLVSGDLYHASKGRGAFFNSRRINTRKADGDDDDIVIGLNVSGIEPTIIKRLSPVMSRANHVRQLGAIALEMCMLARGQLDASIDLRGKIRPTDIAGAYLIVREAGGCVYSGDGKELDAELGVDTHVSLAAVANEKMYRELAGADLFNAR